MSRGARLRVATAAYFVLEDIEKEDAEIEEKSVDCDAFWVYIVSKVVRNVDN